MNLRLDIQSRTIPELTESIKHNRQRGHHPTGKLLTTTKTSHHQQSGGRYKPDFEPQYTLSLKHEDRYLYGGHAEGSALVDYDAFGLDGTETLRGRFTEYDEDGEFVRDYAWFEIKLTDYPPPLKAYHALEFIGSEGGVIIDPNTQEIHSDGLLNSVMMVIAGTTVEVEAQPDQGI